jgi:hypothetical protein
MTAESSKPRAGSRFIDAFLQSPLAGLTPWVVMAPLSGPGRFEESVSAALGLSILFIYLNHRRGGSFKPLELFEVVYFGSLAVIGFLASDNLIIWLEKWSGEMSSLALTAFTFGSLLVHPSLRQGDDAKGVLGFPPLPARQPGHHIGLGSFVHRIGGGGQAVR